MNKIFLFLALGLCFSNPVRGEEESPTITVEKTQYIPAYLALMLGPSFITSGASGAFFTYGLDGGVSLFEGHLELGVFTTASLRQTDNADGYSLRTRMFNLGGEAFFAQILNSPVYVGARYGIAFQRVAYALSAQNDFPDGMTGHSSYFSPVVGADISFNERVTFGLDVSYLIIGGIDTSTADPLAPSIKTSTTNAISTLLRAKFSL